MRASPHRPLPLLPATASFALVLHGRFLGLSEHQLLSILTEAFQALFHLVMNFGKNDPFLHEKGEEQSTIQHKISARTLLLSPAPPFHCNKRFPWLNQKHTNRSEKKTKLKTRKTAKHDSAHPPRLFIPFVPPGPSPCPSPSIIVASSPPCLPIFDPTPGCPPISWKSAWARVCRSEHPLLVARRGLLPLLHVFLRLLESAGLEVDLVPEVVPATQGAV
jgi:hypothetical protein